jgi:hypothetical protein
MSFHLTNRAWDIELKGNTKIVLLALAHMSFQSTGMCTASIARLSFMCGLSDSCVRDQLKTLIAKGHITMTIKSGEHMFRVDGLLTPGPTE